MNKEYNFKAIESKWQQYWQDNNSFAVTEDKNKPKYFVLEMMPYPSGKIHIGHARNYVIGDVVARYKQAKGFNVMHPMAWDAFGLPAENAAIQNNVHPEEWTIENIKNMRQQMNSIGLSYDWQREVTCCLPDYYKHEQKFFIDLYKNNVAYRKKATVNWDPVDNTVLANEQVINGKGWRSGAKVEKRDLEQWFLKITDYSEELLSELDNLKEWPAHVKMMQEKWIGKSEGAQVFFDIMGVSDRIEIFTTRPDTLFGASFIALSPLHPFIDKYVNKTTEIKEFIEEFKQESKSEADIETREKKGVQTNLFVNHPFNKEIKLPVYLANFVLTDVGTGALFACPAHDERDYEFAKKYNLPIKQVVKPEHDIDINEQAYTGEGVIINSEFLNGLEVNEAKKQAIAKLAENEQGSKKTTYRLRDWGVSRQRFWGCPIPMIHCDDCGIVAVKEEDLPVALPKDVDFSKPGNPLNNHPTWKYTSCPQCNKDAVRETDTFDTFFESSWYFARFANAQAEEMVDKKAASYWLPVDIYIGGIEHAVLHLLYARFFTKVMADLDYLDKDLREPFKGLLTQGMVLHKTFKDADTDAWLYPEEVELKDGAWFNKKSGKEVAAGSLEKMSKSKKNVVSLEKSLATVGADTARMFVMSDSPPERDVEYSDIAIEGTAKFLSKFYNLQFKLSEVVTQQEYSDNNAKKIMAEAHQTIKNVEADIENFALNKAIARYRALFNLLNDNIANANSEVLAAIKEAYSILVQIMNPYTPHLCEEIWQNLGFKQSLREVAWPKFDNKYLTSSAKEIAIQVNGKLRGTHSFAAEQGKDEIEKIALSLPFVSKHLDNKEIRKIIIVPGKIVNIVAA